MQPFRSELEASTQRRRALLCLPQYRCVPIRGALFRPRDKRGGDLGPAVLRMIIRRSGGLYP